MNIKKNYLWFCAIVLLVISLIVYDNSLHKYDNLKIAEDIIPPDYNNWPIYCKIIALQEYIFEKQCLEDVQSKHISYGDFLYRATEHCNKKIDDTYYTKLNPCYDSINANSTLYSICKEYVNINLSPHYTWDYYTQFLQSKIDMASCNSMLIFNTWSYADLSKKMWHGSTFNYCRVITQCNEQEFCNTIHGSRCQIFVEWFNSQEEMDTIIRDNEFTEQWCSHSGICYVLSIDWKKYYYKSNISFEPLLQKYNKTIENRWME